MTSGPAREFCIEGDDGERDDAELHDDILDNVAADDAAILAVRNRLIAAGEDPVLMKRFYPLSMELEAA